MTFWDDIAVGSADLFDQAGVPATWNGKPVTVLPGGQGETGGGSPGITDLARVTIQVREAELGGRPQAGAVVVYQGRTWTAQPFPAASAGVWTVGLNQQMQNFGV